MARVTSLKTAKLSELFQEEDSGTIAQALLNLPLDKQAALWMHIHAAAERKARKLSGTDDGAPYARRWSMIAESLASIATEMQVLSLLP